MKFSGVAVSLIAMTLLLPPDAVGQTFTGTYVIANDAGGQTTVTLQQDGNNLTGTISGNGNTMQLQGVREGESMVGVVATPQGNLWFEAQLSGNDLYLTLVGPDANGQPDFNQATTLTFARASNASGAADAWIGTFRGNGLELQLDGGNGSYAGEIRLQGQTFRVTVAGNAATLSGSFRAGADDFPLTLTARGDGAVVLSSGGTDYELRRDAPAVANPSGGGGGAGPEPHDGSDLARQWFGHLAGKMVTYMDRYSSGTDGGYTARTDVHLCSNGQFLLRSESSVSMDVGGAFGSSGGNNAQTGRWRIITQGTVAGVELTYENGAVEQYRVDFQEGATYVNGERWYVTPSEICGG